jgi:hypothetical protein
MIQKIKSYVLMAAAAMLVAVPVGLPVSAYAADCTAIGHKIAEGVNGAVSGQTGDTSCNSDVDAGGGTGKITKLARNIVNVFSILVGIIAVIMIIFGGFRYITSGGDSNRVGGAKNTLIYAIIGLIIVALAQVIVKFVLNQTAEVN